MGHCLGMIFQLIDDCMDFEATESVAQKPVRSDFEKDVITLPIIKAFEADSDLRNKAKRHVLSAVELNEAVRNTKGLVLTRLLAKKYYNKYLRIMDRLTLAEEKKLCLIEVVNKAFRLFSADGTNAQPGVS
jgi:heptaprenyl diphosphate synthase